MSYLVYLNHYDIRQCEAQYLSVLYEVLAKNLPAHFILNKDYIKDYSNTSRWEVRWVRNHWTSYEEIFQRLKPMNYTLIDKPEVLLDKDYYIKSLPILAPSEILRYTYENYLPNQDVFIKEAMRRMRERGEVEAGITWVNNKCFKKVLNTEGIPVIHHEMGPLRPTTYIPTIYFDYSGVNGDTEFDKRFEEFLKVADQVPILDRKELLRIVAPKNYKYLWEILGNKSRAYDIGVGLQVEVDTNLLLFNNSRNWIDPLLAAQRDSKAQKILVRPHPAAGISLKPTDRIEIDDVINKKALDFINRCDKIYCLNSSVGFEALLLGRKSEIFGESPFKSLCHMDEDTLLKALNFTIFGYLIHRDLLFNEDYYKFRLGVKDEVEIYKDNMKRLLEKAKA